VANTGRKEKNVYIVFVGEPEERIQLGKKRRRWEDNIKINRRERNGGKWTGLTCSWITTNSGLLLKR